LPPVAQDCDLRRRDAERVSEYLPAPGGWCQHGAELPHYRRRKETKRVEVTLYTDGACSGNPGPGGWAAVLIWGENRKEISGFEADTTNNRMEITAVVQGLRALTRSCSVRVHSDSSYVVNAFQKRWLDKWKRNGWRTSTGKPVENQDLWLELLSVMEPHKVRFEWVEGHGDDAINNRCDELARQAIKQRGGIG
jgi:ribonuclease HI